MRQVVASVIMIMSLWACQGTPLKEGNDYHNKPQGFFAQYVNPGAYTPRASMTGKTRLVNPAYPIEVALFEDEQLYYMLEKLGDGHGTWSLDAEQGYLRLFASRDIFDMKIDVYSVEAGGNRVKMGFYDRFGWNFLALEARQ